MACLYGYPSWPKTHHEDSAFAAKRFTFDVQGLEHGETFPVRTDDLPGEVPWHAAQPAGHNQFPKSL